MGRSYGIIMDAKAHGDPGVWASGPQQLRGRAVARFAVCNYCYYMKHIELKVARIGNSRGVRLPAATLAPVSPGVAVRSRYADAYACDIPFTSICEHHLLAFTGTATVGYLPGGRLLGLSKLARVVDLHARRPQIQERMTKQIADWLDARLEPRGVGVVVRAEHSCMTLRGARARGSSTVTSALLGLIRTDERTRNEFLTLSERRSQ